MRRVDPRIEMYFRRAAMAFDTPLADVLSFRKLPEHTRPRFAAIYKAYLDGFNKSAIARLSGFDRNTVRNAITKAEVFIEYYPEFRQKVSIL